MAIGALLFWPAALTRTYGMFLLALFTIGTALAILQSVANPFVTIIGPYESAAKRISVMGICNKFAGIIAPLVFAALVIRPQDKEVMDLVEAGLLDGPAKEEGCRNGHHEIGDVEGKCYQIGLYTAFQFAGDLEIGDQDGVYPRDKPEDEEQASQHRQGNVILPFVFHNTIICGGH